MTTDRTRAACLEMLQKWAGFAERFWWDDPQRPDLGCFGSGYNHWGVQTNQKYMGALAVLAADPDLDEAAVGLSREHLLDRALKSLRFSLASHISGDHQCSDGDQWGDTWISGLGIERMMHGVEAVWEHLTEEDRQGVRRMLVGESDGLLDLKVTGTKWAADGGNRPESNLWNGILLARTSFMYPDEPRVDQYMEKAHRFLVNGLSVETDAEDDAVIAGRAVRDWTVGPNFFPNYALDHHGYLNVGYMVICLSNIAIFHFACKTAGWDPPGHLYRHAQELWELVRRLIFQDGRLVRIGGDTRQRYCYCQDYLLPTLLWCADYFKDRHAEELERNFLEIMRVEQQYNGDGGFLSRRLGTIPRINPYYYTRLESDKASVLGMNAYWRRVAGISLPPAADDFEPSVEGGWEEQEHGAVLHRSSRRVASWSWRASEPPQGLCLPPVSGHLAEWCANMGGSVRLLGETGKRKVLRHQQTLFDGGFITTGVVADSQGARLPEGWKSTDPAAHHYAVAALPDSRTMVVMEYCRLGVRTYLSEVKGLKLNVPNDLFTGFSRRYASAAGERVVEGTGVGVQSLESSWACVDGTAGVVGIYGAESLSLAQAGVRRASGFGDSLYYDEVCFPCTVGTHAVDPGAVVLDCASAVLSGTDAAETQQVSAEGTEALDCGHPACRAVRVSGADGQTYLLVAHLAPEAGAVAAAAVSLALPPDSAALDVTTGAALGVREGRLSLTLEPGEAVLARVH